MCPPQVMVKRCGFFPGRSLRFSPFLNLLPVKPPLIANLRDWNFSFLRPLVDEVLTDLKVCRNLFYLHPPIFQHRFSQISRNSEQFKRDHRESCIGCQMFCLQRGRPDRFIDFIPGGGGVPQPGIARQKIENSKWKIGKDRVGGISKPVEPTYPTARL